MSEAIKIVKKNLTVNGKNDLDKYLREKQKIEEQQNIQLVLELLRNNPDITEEMLRSDLRKYFGIAKREYIIELKANDSCIKKR